jgi:hypothetical protein
LEDFEITEATNADFAWDDPTVLAKKFHNEFCQNIETLLLDSDLEFYLSALSGEAKTISKEKIRLYLYAFLRRHFADLWLETQGRMHLRLSGRFICVPCVSISRLDNVMIALQSYLFT